MKLFLAFVVVLMTSFQSVAKNKAAPDFSLPNMAGEQVNLADFEGQVVYLDFWASWCKPCVQSFPKLEALQQKYGDKGFTVIAINLDENQNNALAFLKQHQVSYPVLYDQNAKIAELYQVASMPSAYFIDKAGVIRLNHRGFIPGDEVKIEKAIQFLLKQ